MLDWMRALPRRLLATSSCALLCSGCLSAIDKRADAELESTHQEVGSQFVYPSCNPNIEHGASCGLVLDRVTTPRFKALFREKRCATLDDSSCQRRYQALIDSALEKRYPRAAWDKVTLDCDLHPGRCNGPRDLELRLLDSHNANVRAEYVAREHDIENRRNAAKTAAVFGAIDTAIAVSDEIDYATHKGPKCRTFPSILSRGTKTICDP